MTCPWCGASYDPYATTGHLCSQRAGHRYVIGAGFVGDEKALGRALVPIVENAVASGAVRELRGASRRVRDHG